MTVTAKSADKVVDSIGLAVHLQNVDTPYANYAQVKSALQNLGVRHIRGGINDLSSPNEAAAEAEFRDLASVGIKSTMILTPDSVPPGDTYATQLPNAFNRLGTGVIEMVEGPNEPDAGFQFAGKSFPQSVIDFQNVLWNNLHNAGISTPIIAPSIGNPLDSPQIAGMAFVANYGNTHSYQGARHPEYVDGAGQGFASSNSGLGLTTFYLPYAQQEMSGSGTSNYPIICTETGNPTTAIPAGYTPSGSQAYAGTDTSLWMPNITPSAQAIYTLRTFLHNYNLGVVRTFGYELVDSVSLNNPTLFANKDNANFGLYKCDPSAPTTGNFTMKPAAGALKSLIGLLSDAGTSFTPSPLTYDLTGTTSNVETLLLQKRDGTFWLALWQKARSYDEYNLKDITVQDVLVNLAIPNKNFDVSAYMPYHFATPSTPNWSYSNVSSLGIFIPDHPIILKLTLRAPASRTTSAAKSATVTTPRESSANNF